MSRFDKIINVALILAWALVAYRFGTMYFGAHEQVQDNMVDEYAEPSPPPPPTPTSIPGPQTMRPLVGKCFYVAVPGQPVKYEVCGYRTVRQILTDHYQVYVTGRWTGKWITSEEGGKTKYVGHLYENGDVCQGWGPRQTKVIFKCAAGATSPQMIEVGEPETCKYRVVVGIKEWCQIEKEGLAAANDPTAPVK